MNILARIIARKHEELVEAQARTSPRELAAAAERIAAAEPARDLVAGLRRTPGQPVRVLAEIKRASPSLGPIRPDADPATVGRSYCSHGAAALSVLTDRDFFDGDLRFLREVRDAVPVPLLRKDFLIDPYQVDEAKVAGADAVLLIVAALTPPRLATMLARAHALGLAALVEVHSAAEAEVALRAGVTVLGVNHRDLTTFSIDMSLTGQIAPMLDDDVVLVAESGIRSGADVSLLGSQGAHAVLVGELFMRAPDPGQKLAELLADAAAVSRT